MNKMKKKKCKECGIELEEECPDCGKKIEGGNIICGLGIIPKYHCFNCWARK